MPKGSKSKCDSSTNHLSKEKAKNRVNDLQGIFTNLQTARKESRTNEIPILEEQGLQMLREWNSELNEPSPASSLVGGSLGSFTEDLARLLQQCEEDDDATSVLAEPKAEFDLQGPYASNLSEYQTGDFVHHKLQQYAFEEFNECKVPAPQNTVFYNSEITTGLDSHHFDLLQNFELNSITNKNDMVTPLDFHPFDSHQDFDYGLLVGSNDAENCAGESMPNILPNISPPPSAFLGPKCSLWDCFRPAQGSQLCKDYCSTCHSVLALNEGLSGMTPILRPGGTGLKDGPLFSALKAKSEGREVGIPMCEGAATMKCPWNAPDLFDMAFIEGETIREWLFFDRPRRAFDSGNRKQRSLPDYKGRGWHESRKQVMKEYGGQKRSYYMDPQPSISLEWHLYEYELKTNDTFALYRLELKHVDEKKSPKGKVTRDSIDDLQKEMGKLSAESPGESGQSVKGGTKTNKKADDLNIDPLAS